MYQSFNLFVKLYELEFWNNQTYVLEFVPLHSPEEHSSYFLAALTSTLTPDLHSIRTLSFSPRLTPNCLRRSSSFVFDAHLLLLGHSSLPEHVHTADSLVLEGFDSCSASFLEKCESKSWRKSHTDQEGAPSIMGALLSSVACLFSPLPDQPILNRAFEHHEIRFQIVTCCLQK